MRATTDDGRFGVILARTRAGAAYDPRFFSYQLIIDGTVVGDDEPSIPFTAVRSLLDLKRLDDPRLAGSSGDPEATLAVLRADEVLNDSSLAGNAESLDGWDVRAFIRGGSVTWLAQAYDTRRSTLEGGTHAITVPEVEYVGIAAAVVAYHEALTGLRSRNSSSSS